MKKKIFLSMQVLIVMFYFTGKGQKFDYSENLKFKGLVQSYYYCGEKDGKIYYTCRVSISKPKDQNAPLHLLIYDKEDLSIEQHMVENAMLGKYVFGCKMIDDKIVFFFEKYLGKDVKSELGILSVDLRGSIIEEKMLNDEEIFKDPSESVKFPELVYHSNNGDYAAGDYGMKVFYNNGDYIAIRYLTQVYFFDKQFNKLGSIKLNCDEISNCKMVGNFFVYFEENISKKGFGYIHKIVAYGLYEIDKGINNEHKFQASWHVNTGKILVDGNHIYIVGNKVVPEYSKLYTKDLILYKIDLQNPGLVKNYEISLKDEIIQKSYTDKLYKCYVGMSKKKLSLELGVVDLKIGNLIMTQEKHLIIAAEQFTLVKKDLDYTPTYNNLIIIETDLLKNTQGIFNRYVPKSQERCALILSDKNNHLRALVRYDLYETADLMMVEFGDDLIPKKLPEKNKVIWDNSLRLKYYETISEDLFIIPRCTGRTFNLCKLSLWG